MSSYTMELRKVCDIYTYEEVKSWFTSYNLEDYLTETQIQTITETNIWNKERLAEKIINHYFMREIGFETPYLFRHFAKTKMSEIMERYLPLIYSKSIEFNPLVNVDFEERFSRNLSGTNNSARTTQNAQTHSDNDATARTETIDHDETSQSAESSSNTGTSSVAGSSNSTSTNNSSGLNVNSDTPQGQITKTNILNGSYASSTSANENTASITDTTQNITNTNISNTGTDNISTNKSVDETVTENISRTNSGSINSSENDSIQGSNAQSEQSIRTMKGNSGSITTAQHLIQQFREIIIAVDEQIINELNSLFIGLF